MALQKPLESIGWLSGSGYQVVIDTNAKEAAEASRKSDKDKAEQLRTNESNPKDRNE